MKNSYILISLLAGLAWSTSAPAYASKKADRKITTEKILSNEMGGIAFYKSSCWYGFKNKETGETYNSQTRKNFNITPVPSGTYGVSFIRCKYSVKSGDRIWKYDFSAKDPSLWFEDFNIESGQVIYPGSLIGFLNKYKPEGIYFDHAFKSKPKEFPVFSTVSIKKLEKEVEKKFPDLLGRLETKILEKRLDLEVLNDLIKEPYKPDKSGQKPSLKEADFKASLNYEIYIRTGKPPK